MQLTRTENIDEIIVSTNDARCIEVAGSFQHDHRIKVDVRPERLCTSKTNLRDLIVYCASVCSKKHILWTHVTSPFFDSSDYKVIIERYFEILPAEYDSLLTGRSYKEFLLDPLTNKLVNNKTSLPWPRTQDLQDFFEINNAVFMAPGELFSKGERVGEKPFYVYSGKIPSIDVDDMDDFKLAEALYERISG